ncbi:MAG: hypothetical protein LBR74_04660 [Eubacterium sp.]|jgi:hypothetical protein|nr:hypothetical protein [Eubacterium sp.]
MLERWKGGQWEALYGIGSRGYIGQVVVYGQRVDFGKNPDPVENPLAFYPYPSVFTITEKAEGKDVYYILKDCKGKSVKQNVETCGDCELCLYDADEWLAWKVEASENMTRGYQREISRLEDHITLLKDILIKQGIRIITEEAAEKLGIK